MIELKRQIWAQIALLSAIALLGLFLMQTGLGILSDQSARIQDQKAELVFRIAFTEQLPGIRAAAEQAKNLLPTLSKIAPPKNDLQNFDKTLADLARKNRLTASVSLDNQLHFSLIGTGTLASLISFLKELGKGPLAIKIDSSDISRKTSDGTFNVVLNGQVFHQD